jgi:hypothetical protein
METNGKGCVICQKPTTKTCGRCFKEKYCSKECQVLAWKNGHKLVSQGQMKIPKNSFGQNLLGKTSQDNVFIWIEFNASLIEMLQQKIIHFKILILNSGDEVIKLNAKSPLLMMKSASIRKKVSSKLNPKFIDINGTKDDQIQISISKNQYAELVVGFDDEVTSLSELEKEIQNLVFVELPVKIDTKGVVKMKVDLEEPALNSFLSKAQDEKREVLSNVD